MSVWSLTSAAAALTRLPWPGRWARPGSRAARTARGLRWLLPVLLVPAACLVPPDAPVRAGQPNTAPRIDLGSLDPAASLFEADLGCPCVGVRAEVFDADDDALEVRVATNVGRDGNRVRCRIETRTPPAGFGQVVEPLVVPTFHLAGFPGETVHTISMYVTDADAFSQPLSDSEDCAQIPAVDGGSDGPFLIEQRWTVRFVSGLGQCPGCRAPGT